MDKLREELNPNASPKRIEEVKNKINEIENSIRRNEDVKILIEAFNKFTNRSYDKEFFLNYWAWESIDDFARDAAQPLPQKIDNISKEELIEIVDRIRNADDNPKLRNRNF